jgi:hypothetical protein
MGHFRRNTVKVKKFSLVLIVALALVTGLSAQDIDLISLASGAQWSASDTTIQFGRDGQARGTAKYINDARLEDGQTYPQVLFMHPPFQRDGVINGMIQNVRIPAGGAKLIIAGGFLEGAGGTDGVLFGVGFRRTDAGARGNARLAAGLGREAFLCSFPARYDRRIDRVECDLSGLADQVGTILLHIRAGNSADSDWAVWTEARITSGAAQQQISGASGAEAQMINAYKGHDYRVDSVQFSPNGRYALTIDSDNQAKVWQFPGGRVKLILRGSYFQPPCFSSDSRFVAIGKRGGTAEIWEIESENMVRTLQGHTGDVFTAIFSPDGRYIVTASADGYAKVWNVSTGSEILAIKHSDRSGIVVRSAAFSPDGRYIITAGEDNVARIWEIRF